MSIAKTVDLVVAAKEAGYAVPAVNIVDDLSLRAVVTAAEEAQLPVIIQTSVKTVKSIGAPLLSFNITQLGASPTSGDRVLAYVAIGLPKPLNVIELHLVA